MKKSMKKSCLVKNVKETTFKLGSYEEYCNGQCEYWAKDGLNNKCKQIQNENLISEVPLDVNEDTHEVTIDYAVLRFCSNK